MNLQQKAAKGIVWTVLEKWGGQLISLLILLVLSRLLEPTAFGLVALASVFTALIEILIDQGLGDAIVQRVVLEPEHLSSAFWANIVAGGSLMLATILLADLIAVFFKEPELGPVLKGLSLTFLFTALSSTQNAILRRDLAFDSLAKRVLTGVFAGGVAGLGLAFLGGGVWSLVAQAVVKSLGSTITLWWLSDWRPEFLFSKKHFLELLSFGISSGSSKILDFVNRHADDLLIGYVLGSTALGYYNIAYRLLPMMLRLLTGITNAIGFPLFSRLQQEPDKLKNTFFTVTRWTSLIAFPVFSGVSLLAPELVLTLFGAKWMPSIPVMQILAFIGILQAVLVFHSSVIKSVGKPAWDMAITLLNAVANVVVFSLVVKQGIVAVATSYVLVGYALVPISAIVVCKLLQIDIKEYLRQYIPALIGSLIMGTMMLSLKTVLSSLIDLPWQLAVYLFAGGLTYLISIHLITLTTFQDILRFFELMLPSRSQVNVSPARWQPETEKEGTMLSRYPVVSVIITVYNGEEHVEQAINSVLQQSLPEFELVIVDDGSDDQTPQILANTQAGDSRVRVITMPRIGRAKALNLGWKESTGTYIAILDADDLAEPDRLEKQVAFLKSHPEIGLLGTACRNLYDHLGDERLISHLMADAELRKTLVRYNPFVHSTIMMPRRVLEEVGGYNEKFQVGIDYELWVRLASRYQIANLPDVLAVRRMGRHNFFLHHVSSWKRCQAKIVIRWYAWRKFSRKLTDLYFVFPEPLGKWLNALTGGRLSSGFSTTANSIGLN